MKGPYPIAIFIIRFACKSQYWGIGIYVIVFYYFCKFRELSGQGRMMKLEGCPKSLEVQESIGFGSHGREDELFVFIYARVFCFSMWCFSKSDPYTAISIIGQISFNGLENGSSRDLVLMNPWDGRTGNTKPVDQAFHYLKLTWIQSFCKLWDDLVVFNWYH